MATTTTTPPKLEIAIIGAGIAGLTAAIALKHHPAIDVQIYERASALKEIGASIALGPNGLRTLERLGINNALDESIAFRNKSGYPMIYRHYQTDEVVSVDKHVGPVEARHRTARFYRAHLQEALLAHVDPTRIHLSRAFQSAVFNEAAGKLVVTFADGTTATADVVLGADGIQSAVRQYYVPSSSTKWTGWVAFRSVFPISHVAHIPDLPDEAIHVWGPDRTLFASKLGRGLFAIVGTNQSDPDDPANEHRGLVWDGPSSVDILRDYYRDWSPLVRALVDATPHIRAHPNVSAKGIPSWVLADGRVTLAGDAAHAHGGAFAAGGSLAIDDAWAFAASLLHVFPASSTTALSADGIRQALALYERTRKAHTDRVLTVVHAGNQKKIDNIGRTETDEQLRHRIQNRVDPSWIHEHNVQEAFAKALAEEVPQARL